MASRISMPVKYTLSALLTLLFLYLAFRGTDVPQLLQSMRSANYWWLAVTFVLLIISHFFRAWRWRYLLDPIKPGIGMRNLFSGVMIGYMVNNILPRAGELARPYALGKLENISKSAALGTIVVERLVDAISFLILVILLPFLYNGPLTESFPWLQPAMIIVSTVTCGILALLIILMLRRDWTNILLTLVDPMLPRSIASRARGMVHSFLDGLLFLKRPAGFMAILVLSFLIWFMYALMTYVAFFAFGLQDTMTFRSALVVLAISSIGVAIPTPGGTGSYHALTSQSLSRLFFVNPAVALSYATLTHAVQFIGVMILGSYYFFRDNIKISEAVRVPGGHE